MTDLLIIFVKNPVLGKVKTRLARDIGPEKALDIYKKLLIKTHDQTCQGAYDKWLFYADKMASDDLWDDRYKKKAQLQSPDLGQRMADAFAQGFEQGYTNICIIGSDCYELTSEIIDDAFTHLGKHDFVVGPANDGGYYLLGMNHLENRLFLNKEWSTEEVYPKTIQDLQSLQANYFELPELVDIDNIDDLNRFPELF